jgi:hypothetical protein
MRRFFAWFLGGALVGTAVATTFAPTVLEALLASTGAQDAMCQCSQLVHRTATRLIMVQLIGAAIGAVTFPLGAWLVRRKFGKEPEGAVPAA